MSTAASFTAAFALGRFSSHWLPSSSPSSLSSSTSSLAVVRSSFRRPSRVCVSMTSAAASPGEAYDRLATLCRDITSVQQVLGLLGWDEQVMMPAGAASVRGKHKAALTAVLHEKNTSSTLRDAIQNAHTHLPSLDQYQRAVVRDAHRNYTRAVGVPASLETEIAEHEVEAMQAWIAARKNDDFDSFAPFLEKTLRLCKDKAMAIDPNTDPYDTMIDSFERGMTASRITEIFQQVEKPVRDLLRRTLDAKRACGRDIHPALKGGEDWSIDRQEKLSRDMCDVIGFDFDKGRIDVSVHPFTGGAGPSDVRITTRYSTQLPFEGIMGTVHEVGHALYEQGRNREYDGLPVSEALSMGAHESQSLFMERYVGQSRPFWKLMVDKMHHRLPHTQSANADDLFFAINQVDTGLIRVEADELSYPLHIMLRFNLERQLVSGELPVSELPARWRQGMKDLLDVDVPTDREGCLQDIHWAMGAFGYFPSYLLGAMVGAQLWRLLKSETMPDIEDIILVGDLKAVVAWLREHIHAVGSVYPSLDELLEKVTGEKLNPNYLVEYLDQKYAQVYAPQ